MQFGKRIDFVTLLLLLVMGGAAGCASAAPAQQGKSPSAPAAGRVLGTPLAGAAPTQWVDDLSQLPPGTVSHVDVVYFHRAERCTSCLNAENYTRETLDTHFANQVKAGWMSLQVLDVEKAENAAMVQKFDAAGSALYFGIRIQGAEYLCANPDIWFFTTNKYLFVDTLNKKLALLVGRG